MNAHTPGPWKVVRDAGALTLDVGVTDYNPGSDDFRGMIAWISETNGIPREEREANAQLIASAPALEAENAKLRKALRELVARRERACDEAGCPERRDGSDGRYARARALLKEAP